MDKKPILIIGTGAQAKYALEIFHLTDRQVVGLLNIAGELSQKKIDSVKILGVTDDFEKYYFEFDKPEILISCSSNRHKEQLHKSLVTYDPVYTNAIHPRAIIARTSKIGSGVIINANAVVQPFATIGSHVMIHAGSIVEHDCIIGDFVNIAPNATITGHVKLKKGVTIYAGAVISPTIEVGSYSIVGAGSVVLKNIKKETLVIGSPATKK